ncbi:hypothetical protein QO002_001821 [Pararhizobium capsulatum DSM 1112]|uniref:Uncharacterized protein n=1 Tax=Pararhizobium capsulatum DSM 1112 TaxID=1121113 RepID=A0ABU0BN58_9HYPH|nr:hypothetical protein [Pararhizobium capsulatum]MDQ0319683.1 hypothetical protein [Pararhizobium capsulatum DSM 1112]
MSVRAMDSITHDVIYSAPIDEVAAALSRHDGDVRATIRGLLNERKRLREELALTEIYIGESLAIACARADYI